MKWEKIIEVYNNNKYLFSYKGIITTSESHFRGTTYKIEMQRCHNDGSKETLETLWHDTLAGAKNFFDRDFKEMGKASKWVKLESE